MKKIAVFLLLVGGASLGFAPAAGADSFRFGFRIGFGHHGRSYRHHDYRYGHRLRNYGHHRHHRHHRVPYDGRIWVPPVYRSIVVGYDGCGLPIYRRVHARAGYYHRGIRGYRCSLCGAGL